VPTVTAPPSGTNNATFCDLFAKQKELVKLLIDRETAGWNALEQELYSASNAPHDALKKLITRTNAALLDGKHNLEIRTRAGKVTISQV
jgi:hypothetical protein